MGVGKINFASASHEWPTPDSLWNPLNEEFAFTLDVAATSVNAKCRRYFDQDVNGLTQQWEGVCWMNPPFGRQIKHWVIKAFQSAQQGATVVCLLPCRTNTNWWHDYVMRGEVRFIRGCPKFGDSKRGLWLPLAIVIFRPSTTAAVKATASDDNEDDNRCTFKLGEDAGGPIICDTTVDNNVHHKRTDPGYHEFQSAAAAAVSGD